MVYADTNSLWAILLGKTIKPFGLCRKSVIYEKFTNEGYVILLPTYPIGIEAWGSEGITIVSTVSLEDKIIPIGVDSEIVIEVFYGNNKLKTQSFPFYLSQQSVDFDDTLIWLKTQDK